MARWLEEEEDNVNCQQAASYTTYDRIVEEERLFSITGFFYPLENSSSFTLSIQDQDR